MTPNGYNQLLDILGPFVVLADNRKNVWSNAIKLHTHGQYSHAMWMRRPGMVVSQNGQIEEKPIEEYLKDWIRLKFYGNTLLSEEKEGINRILDEQIARRTGYDWLGIVGHLLNCRSLNFSSRYYCSEAVWEPFVKIWGYQPIYPTPADLDWLLPQLGWEVIAIHDPLIQSRTKALLS